MPRAYYNEIDTYNCQWLRNLIAAGLIMDGDVDERSIEDVTGEDLHGYTRVHLFAGVGGWDFALQLAGWPEGREIWTGSCPCQPFSAAGQRRGTDDPRHLWPHMRRIVAECRPAVTIGEQVASADGREWLAGVFADLEALAYRCAGADLCAACVSAPHIRQRLFWVADASGSRTWQDEHWIREGACGTSGGEKPAHRLADAEDAEYQKNAASGRCREIAQSEPRRGCVPHRLANPERDGRGPDEPGRGQEGRSAARGAGASGGVGDAADDGRNGQLQSGGQEEARRLRFAERPDGISAWGSTWLPCSDGTARRAQPGIHPLAHGIPRGVADCGAWGTSLGDSAAELLRDARRFRRGVLKGAGNAIVPEVAAEFVKAYMDARPD